MPAFIHWYKKVNRRPPAEVDICTYFGIRPPSAHQMVVTLTRKGLIQRQPGTGRSMAVLVDPLDLPALE